MLLTTYNGAILGPIAKLLGWIMNGIYYVMDLIGIQNVGLTTIIFTIVIYAFMFPLTYKQQKFSKLSQKMQPEIQAIQKKYANKKDQQSMMAMNEETQAVYQKYGVSMSGSCVQLLIQMPVFFALYRVFMNVPAYVSGVKANFMPLVNEITKIDGFQDKMAGLVTDLRIVTSPMVDFTATDPSTLSNYVVDVLNKLNTAGWDKLADIFPTLSDNISATYETVSHVNNFIAFNIADTPWNIITSSFSNGTYLLAFGALLIPVISYLTQVLNIKLMPQASQGNGSGNEQADAMANQMKMMNNIMPVFSLVMCFTVPVGLGLYWIASALARGIQQFFLNKHFDHVDLDDIIKKNQEKAKKKREKMGISENQIYNAARINAKKIETPAKKDLTFAEKEQQIEKANAAKSAAKPGSMAAKANRVKEFNERNTKK
ncbi:MAG: YidC/Oxa1 family membrane protein insertase [Roseburia sp.]